MEAAFGFSERRACELLEVGRSTVRYLARAPDRQAVRERLRSLATERPRFGYRRLHLLLRREGFAVNHKCVYRLYREQGLQVRRRRRKRVTAAARPVLGAPTRVNERWSIVAGHVK